jgi:ankyrin repeat protein
LGILQALIGAKATIDVKDDNGSSPLLWSVTAQCPTDFARALVAAGADVNVKAKGGGTPLMLAKVFQRADLVELLVKAGAR